MSRAERSRDAFENNDPPSSRSAHETSFEPGHELDSALGVAGMWGVIEGSSSSIALLAALYCSGATGQLAARVAAIAGVGGAAASAARGWARCALEHATYTRERAREEWELKHYEEGERKEVVDLWVSRGVSRVDAEAATAALSGYKEVFVDIMMDQEVQIHAPRFTPLAAGVTAFSSNLFSFMLPPLLLWAAAGVGKLNFADAWASATLFSLRALTITTLCALGPLLGALYFVSRSLIPLHAKSGRYVFVDLASCVFASVLGAAVCGALISKIAGDK